MARKKKEVAKLHQYYEEAKTLADNLRLADSKFWGEAGVRLVSPQTTWIDQRARIGVGTIIFPNCVIMGASEIGRYCVLLPNTVVMNCHIHNHVVVGVPHLKHSRIGTHATLGSLAELNKCQLDEGVKMMHHGYLGNTEVGAHANVGAGAVVANFDGKNKNRTSIGPGAFIGVNTSLIAPLAVGGEALIGAGAVVTEEVFPHEVIVGVNQRLMDKYFRRVQDGWEIVEQITKKR